MNEIILPDYSKNQVALASEILGRFGIDYGRSSLGALKGNNKKLSLVLMDGLGWNLFSGLNTLWKGNARKITSVFPSTTSSSLVSLFTGTVPATHGVLGYRSFLKEAGSIVKFLEFTYAPSHREHLLSEMGDAHKFVTVRSIFHRLKRKNIRSAVLVPGFLSGTDYSSLLYDGATEIVGYWNIWEAFSMYKDLLDDPKIKFVSFYIPEIDEIEHVYGFDSDIAKEAATFMLNKLHAILSRRRKYTDVVITSDHGHITLGKRIDMRSNKKLMGKLEIPPYGDGRAPLFRSRSDITQELSKYKLKLFGKSGFNTLFGGQGNKDRMPDFVGVPMDNSYYEYDFKMTRRKRESTMVSNHGGLSPDEMEIPLLTF